MKKALPFLIFFILLFSQKTYAQTITLPMPTPEASTPSAAPTGSNYFLPYPGILPGNPLYSVKLIRDKIKEFTTQKTLDKSYFYLLQSDKRLAAGIVLFDSGDQQVSENTISKGQNYLEKSMNKMVQARSEGENVMDLSAKIKASTLKQKEVLEKLSEKSNGETQKKFKEDLKRAEKLQKRADSFKQ